MAENEIITREDPQMQLFSQLMEGTLKKLERYCHERASGTCRDETDLYCQLRLAQ